MINTKKSMCSVKEVEEFFLMLDNEIKVKLKIKNLKIIYKVSQYFSNTTLNLKQKNTKEAFLNGL